MSVVKFSTLRKKKTNFDSGSTITKVNIEHSKKVIKKFLRNVFTLTIDDWNFVIFEQCQTHEQLNETETFWQHKLKTFYPISLSEKEEYLY